MIEPRTFYKNLDTLLNKIVLEQTETNFLFLILSELEHSFGPGLHFVNGRIYQRQKDGLELTFPPKESLKNAVAPMIPATSESVRLVAQYGMYIFDNSSLPADFGLKEHADYSIPVAFVVKSHEEEWILVYDLKGGWVREEIEFCFNAVRAALNFRLYSETIENDLQQAATIQQSLLPKQAPEIPGYEIAFRSEASVIIVGDFYDFFKFDRSYFGICIGDAAGHGLPGSLLVRDVVTGLRMGLEKEMKMVHTLKKLNRVIHQSTFSTRFASLFYGEIEDDGHLIYVNAGHPPPLLVSKDQVRELKATGPIIGVISEINLHQAFTYFKPGDWLVLYSDGIIERLNAKGEFFGIERLKQLVQVKNLSAREILNLVFKTVFEFGAGERWQDDATVIVIKRTDQ